MLCSIGCQKMNLSNSLAFTFSTNESSQTATISSFVGDNLKSILIPTEYQNYSVTSIGTNVFNYKNLLTKKLNIQSRKQVVDGVEVQIKDTLNKYLLKSLQMETIDIPTNITSIGSGAFLMPSLKIVRAFNTTPPVLGTDAIVSDVPLTIYVPLESLDAYQAEWTSDKIRSTADTSSTTTSTAIASITKHNQYPIENIQWKTF